MARKKTAYYFLFLVENFLFKEKLKYELRWSSGFLIKDHTFWDEKGLEKILSRYLHKNALRVTLETLLLKVLTNTYTVLL